MKPSRKSNFKDKIRGDSERQKKEKSSFGYLNLPKGFPVFTVKPNSKVYLDFLPYLVSDEHHPDRNPQREIAIPNTLWYKRPFKSHWISLGDKGTAYVCPMSIGKKCPICEYRAKRIQEGAEKEELIVLKPSSRNLYIVIPINHEDYDQIPHIWDFSQYCFQDLLNDDVEEDDDIAKLMDLEDGVTLKIRFESKSRGSGRPFPNANRIDPVNREKQYDESIVDELPNLDKILNVLPYKELSDLFYGLDNEDVATDKEEIVDDELKRKRKTNIKEEQSVADKLTWEKLEHKSFTQLSRIIKKQDLDIDPEDYEDDVASLRKKVAKHLDIQVPKPDKPKRSITRKTDEKSSKCPFGHKFGEDCEEFDDCEECELWEKCWDAKEDD